MTTGDFMAGLGRNSLQAGVLVVVILLAQWLSGKRLAPRWRCALWIVVVARLLVPLSFSSAASVFNLLPHWGKSVRPALVETSFPKTDPTIARAPVPENNLQTIPSTKPPAVSPPPILSATNITPQVSWPWTVFIFWIWLAGTAVLLGHILISSIRLARRCARLHPLTDLEAVATLKNCCERLKMQTPPMMLEGEVSSPALHGLFRPRLLLPKGFVTKFSQAELRFVFLHELAHLKRRDLLMNWVMALLQSAHWFNPLVWLGFARWREDRELACDTMVLEATGAGQNKEYGQTILRLLENFTHPLRMPGLVGILEDKRQLRRRIGMIATYAPSPRWSLPAIILIATLAIVGLTDARNNDMTNGAPPVISISADTNPPPRLTVELRDGSRVVGESVGKYFKFHSDLLGDLKLAANDIRSVECVSSNSVKLTVANGDTLAVQFVDSSFAVKTSFGKVDLAADSIRKFTMSVSMAAGAYPPGLVALWKGADNGKDSAGNNDAILTDISLVESDMGQAFSFNGESSSIKIPASTSLDIGAGEGFTIMAWVKPTDVEGYHPLFTWMENGVAGVNSSICFNSTQSGALMICPTDGTGNRFLVSNQRTLASGVFQHIAITYDKASGIGTWYMDGVVVAQRHLSGQVASTKGDLWISHRNTHQGDWSSNQSYSGLMDRIALYNRALTDTEIQAICSQESHGEPLALPTPSSGWYESWMQ